MRVEYYHASRFGNGALVAEEFRTRAAALGATVNVHHISDAKPQDLPPADLYVFSSPGQMGKPIKQVRRFLSRLALPAGSRCAILTTELAPRPDKETGAIPSDEELAKWQRVRPIMNELLESAGLIVTAEDAVLVTDIKGPLENGWEVKVEKFLHRVLTPMTEAASHEPGSGDSRSTALV